MRILYGTYHFNKKILPAGSEVLIHLPSILPHAFHKELLFTHENAGERDAIDEQCERQSVFLLLDDGK
jgi:hypothetical protein